MFMTLVISMYDSSSEWSLIVYHKQIEQDDNLTLGSNILISDSKLDTAQMHEALFGIQSGLGDGNNDRIDYLDGTKRTRLEIGHYVYQNYRYDACLDEPKALGDIEMVRDVV